MRCLLDGITSRKGPNSIEWHDANVLLAERIARAKKLGLNYTEIAKKLCPTKTGAWVSHFLHSYRQHVASTVRMMKGPSKAQRRAAASLRFADYENTPL